MACMSPTYSPITEPSQLPKAGVGGNASGFVVRRGRVARSSAEVLIMRSPPPESPWPRHVDLPLPVSDTPTSTSPTGAPISHRSPLRGSLREACLRPGHVEKHEGRACPY